MCVCVCACVFVVFFIVVFFIRVRMSTWMTANIGIHTDERTEWHVNTLVHTHAPSFSLPSLVIWLAGAFSSCLETLHDVLLISLLRSQGVLQGGFEFRCAFRAGAPLLVIVKDLVELEVLVDQ